MTSATATDWTEGLLEGLNPAQRQAAEAVRGPLCILAGAGTGKTRTVTHRIANQVATGEARPDQILAVTFTDRAAAELRQRLTAIGMPGTVRAATFHSAAWAQVRHFWHRISDRPLPQVLPSKLRLLIPEARKHRVQASDLAGEIEWARARRLDADGYVAHAQGRDAPLPPGRMAHVIAAYEQAKRDQDLIDFEDMLAMAADAIAGDEAVAAEFRERYRYFTVDEFQDVNPAQQALLDAWLGPRSELCVVGDDDQTIYRFTGATPEYLTGFSRRFPDAHEVTLTRNYRSSPQVLALANRVLWTKAAPSRKRLQPTCPDGAPPVFAACDDDEAEQIAVVAEIRRLMDSGVRPGEIAVGYRINAQSAEWEEALQAAGIGYLVRGDGGFFSRPEIRQALQSLRAASAAGEPEPEPGPGGSVPAHAPSVERQVERTLRTALSWHPRRAPAGAAARERWENIGALHALVGRLVREHPTWSPAEVSAELSARAAAGHDAPDEDGLVTLLTIHRAKGLEFDAVFLVGCEEGLLPISRATDDQQVEDERRLFYVGVTRARRFLHLSWAATRTGRSGRTQRRRPSRFLYGLGEGAPVKSSPARSQALPFDRKTTGETPLTAEQQELADRLRTWRKERAARDGVPAFVVFNDRTLRALARSGARGAEDLIAVHGFGAAKVDRYGDELLQIMRAD